MINEKCKKVNNDAYKSLGFSAQREYPNEEFLRFLGRNYKGETNKKFLELGSGSCSNLWAVAKMGFDAYGIDLADECIELGHKMLEKWGTKANLSAMDMTKLDFKDNEFDCVFDVFSMYSINYDGFEKCIKEISRILKPGGRFFSYHPSTGSDAFINYFPAEKIDEYTLNEIKREDSPYYPHKCPFRFVEKYDFKAKLEEAGFEVNYLETVTKTYSQFHIQNNKKENMEFVIIEAIKK